MSEPKLTPMTSRHPPVTRTPPTGSHESPSIHNSGPDNEHVFLTTPTGTAASLTPSKSQRHTSSVFHISPLSTSDFVTSPDPHTPTRAVTTTPTRARTAGNKRDATAARLTVRPLIRRVPPPEIAALILKSPRKGRIAARFHALETHFAFFRQYHRDLIQENASLSQELEAAQVKLKEQSNLHQDTDQLREELARTRQELADARLYLTALRDFVGQESPVSTPTRPQEGSTMV